MIHGAQPQIPGNQPFIVEHVQLRLRVFPIPQIQITSVGVALRRNQESVEIID